MLSGCYLNRELCPAYVHDPVPAGTYNYNGPYECSTWYESRYGWMWSTDLKDDALQLWANISGRPMYFELEGRFRYTVKAKDGFKYNFWRYKERDFWTESAPHWQYYISVQRPRSEWNSVPL